MTDVEPARRSLELLTVGANAADDIVLLLLCDCGTATELTLEGLRPSDARREFAYTCDDCLSTHWLTVGRAEGLS